MFSVFTNCLFVILRLSYHYLLYSYFQYQIFSQKKLDNNIYYFATLSEHSKTYHDDGRPFHLMPHIISTAKKTIEIMI